jgi:hypothetical protein
MTSDFAGNDPSKMEYMKQVTMDQECTYTRSDKVSSALAGGSSVEGFQTRIIRTIHYETRVIATNYGALGIRESVDPDDARRALTERSFAQIVHPTACSDEADDAAFMKDMDRTEMRVRINQLRLVSSLVAYVLIFIKELPFCRPNLRYASRLTEEWDHIFRTEYDIPTPTNRKKIKRRMLLELFAVESAVVEKFFSCMESSVEFEDMRPDADGQLSEWHVTQLADVVRNIQRHVDFENILNAWSHNLDHSVATAALPFHVKTVLAQMHGDAINLRQLRTGAAPERALGGAAGPSSSSADGGGGGLAHGANEGDPLRPPTAQGAEAAPGASDAFQAILPQPIMSEGLTRAECNRVATQLGTHRQLRNKMSSVLADSATAPSGLALDLNEPEHDRLTRIAQTDASMCKIHVPGPVAISPKTAAGAMLPSLDEVLNSGVPRELLEKALNGRAGGCAELGLQANSTAMIGVGEQDWEYKRVAHNSNYPGPADYDIGWVRMKPDGGRGGGQAQQQQQQAPPSADPAPDGGGGGTGIFPSSTAIVPAGGGKGGGASGGGKSVWTRMARKVQQVVRDSNSRVYSLPEELNVNESAWRDALYMVADGNDPSNQYRIPRRPPLDLVRGQALLSGHSPINGPVLSDPSEVCPAGIFQSRQRTSAFLNPPAFARPPDAVPVENSVFQRRLDHFNNQCALPTCVRPQGFRMASPIQEDKSDGGTIYWNKWVSGGHAAWVVECAALLSNVPGLSGHALSSAPDALKARGARSARPRGPTSRTPMDVDGNAPVATDGRSNPAPPSAQLQHVVENPDAQPMDTTPEPGANAKADAAPLRADYKVPSMVYNWDMQAMAMTIIANDTLHYDWEGRKILDAQGRWDGVSREPSMVETQRAYNPAAFAGEELATTLRDRPQHSLRFPCKHGKANILMPLTRAVPIKETRFAQASKPIENATMSSVETYALLQQEAIALGRPLNYSSLEYKAAESKLKNTDDLQDLSGNLFARSTWVDFTMQQLQQRGHDTDDEVARLHDQGIWLRLRVRNAKAATAGPPAADDPYSALIGKVQRASLTSFEAQERMMVDYADDPEGGGGDYGDLIRLQRQMREAQSRSEVRTAGMVRKAWTRDRANPPKKPRA